MADAQIRECTVAPTANGLAVRVQISDAQLSAENATTLLDLRLTLPQYEAPLLLQVQREAIVAAIDVLRTLDQQLSGEIQRRPHTDLEPKVRQRRTQVR